MLHSNANTTFETRLLADGVHYILPPRNLEPIKWLGRVVMLLGVIVIFVNVCILLSQVSFNSMGPNTLGNLIGATPFVLLGLTLLSIGKSLPRGYGEVLVTRDKLQVIDRVGFWRFRRHRPIDAVTGLEVVTLDTSSASSETGLSSSLAALRELAVVKAFCKTGPVMLVAVGYDSQLLRELADDLALQLEKSTDLRRIHRSDKPAVTVSQRTFTELAGSLTSISSHVQQNELREQPVTSKIRVESIEGGLSVNIPPSGVVKGSKGLIFMAVFWLIITGGISLAMLSDRSLPWVAIPFMGLFWAIGIGMVVAAMHMGRKRAIMDVIGDTLLVTESGMFGTKQHEWSAEQITSIRMGPSGMKVNNRDVMQLQVHPTQGKHVGLFTGRDKDELCWLATLLNDELALNTPTDVNTANHSDSPDTLMDPYESNTSNHTSTHTT